MLELERCDGFETPPLADIVSVLCTSEGTMVKPLLMVRVTEGNVAAGRSLNILGNPYLHDRRANKTCTTRKRFENHTSRNPF